MILRIFKQQKQAKELFPDLNSFITHLLSIDKNLRNDNEIGVMEYKRLYEKMINENNVINFSYIVIWYKQFQAFKTHKYGNIDYWIERGWLEDDAKQHLEKRKNEAKKRNLNCIDYWVKKGYSEEESKEKIRERQTKFAKQVKHKTGITIEKLKNKNWNDEQIKKFTNSRSIFCVEFWLKKGYLEEEAIKKISEIQKNNSKKGNVKKNNNKEEYYKTRPTRIEYWINKGYSFDEAKKMLRERQKTFTLEKCILKYGKIEGIKKYNERQEKWKESLNKNNGLKRGYSSVSQELFYAILEYYKNKDKKNVFFATKNKEFGIEKTNGGVFFYDFADIKKKKIIEFNGDLFHGNPKMFKPYDNPNPFNKNIIAEELWNKDQEKINHAINNNFDTLVVWESEYNKNKKEIVNKCIKFINNEKNY